MRRTTGIIWILLVVAGQAAAQSRPATNLVTHSEVIIARSATAIWPWILDPSTWKHGAALSHRSGPIGGVGEVFAAYEPGDKAKVAFFVENVALATNRRRTIKLYSPTMALVGYAVWTLEEVSGRTSVSYDVYTESLIPRAKARTMTALQMRMMETTDFAASQKRFDEELVALKRLADAGPAVADSFPMVVANRVVLDIAAPANLVWSFLPGIRKRPNVERVPLNGPLDQFGSRFDVIYRDSTGTITRHDRIEVLEWQPGVRYVAHVQYLPPGESISIIYNVDLKESGGVTHFVMDAYSSGKLSDPGADPARVASLAAHRQEWQDAVTKGYLALKGEIESAAKR